MNIRELMDTTHMTSVEIIEHLGITYQEFFKTINRTEAEDRDAKINIYDLVGHDGTSTQDRCQTCSIIMLKEYSITPDRWGEFQRAVGGICTACLSDLSAAMPEVMSALITAGCTYCGKEAGIYFLQDGVPGSIIPDPHRAVPLCLQHRRKLHELEKDDLLRDFYDRVDTGRLFAIICWSGHNPMPRWDVVCPSCGYRYMPDGPDMLLGDALWECSVCAMCDETPSSPHCPQCCPANLPLTDEDVRR